MIHQLVTAALLFTQAAPAAPDCITAEEAGDMAVTLLPYLVDAAAERCRPQLAAGAFLLTGAADWSARLRRDAAPRRVSALRAISKFGGATPPSGAGGDAAFDFFAQMMTATLTSDLRPEYCGRIDTLAQSLAPLPTENLAGLVSASVALAMLAPDNDDDDDDDDDRDNDRDDDHDEEDGDDGPPICRA